MNELSSIFSIPSGVVAIIVGLLSYFYKQGPVTMLTASPLEKLFYSKEKQLVVKVLQYIVHSLISSFFISYATWVLYSWNVQYLWQISIFAAAIILAAFSYFLVNNLREKSFNQLYSTKSNRTKFILIALNLLSMTSVFVLTSYYIASSILSSIDGSASKLELGITTLIFALLSSLCIVLPFLKQASKFMLNEKTPSFFVKEAEQTWYIYNTFDKERMLLGNHSNLKQATEFTLRERVELLKSPTLHLETQDID